MNWLNVYIVFFGLILVACVEEVKEPVLDRLDLNELPPGFPAISEPEGNKFTAARWELGKALFYDPILSLDGTISCSSCHDPALAFSDSKAFSEGSGGLIGTRNSPSLANVAYHPYYTREGGVPTLEMQILVPIQEHDEFNNNIVRIADTLSKIPSYVEMANLAYDQNPNAFVITRAISQFERSLISGQSTYDAEINYELEGSMSESALRGLELFNSDKASCASCHGGFNFTNYAFENNGLYEEYPDEGRARLTLDVDDTALFKVPSLRNIELSGPYMHDGSMNTLEEVVEHYDSGGENHFNKSELIRPLLLTEVEKNDLVSFLKSLTDKNFISNEDFIF